MHSSWQNKTAKRIKSIGVTSHRCYRHTRQWPSSTWGTAPSPEWRSWGRSNPGKGWRKMCPCCPWGDVSIALGCVVPPMHCRSTAPHLTMNCATVRIWQRHLKTAGHMLDKVRNVKHLVKREKVVITAGTEIQNYPETRRLLEVCYSLMVRLLDQHFGHWFNPQHGHLCFWAPEQRLLTLTSSKCVQS